MIDTLNSLIDWQTATTTSTASDQPIMSIDQHGTAEECRKCSCTALCKLRCRLYKADYNSIVSCAGEATTAAATSGSSFRDNASALLAVAPLPPGVLVEEFSIDGAHPLVCRRCVGCTVGGRRCWCSASTATWSSSLEPQHRWQWSKQHRHAACNVVGRGHNGVESGGGSFPHLCRRRTVCSVNCSTSTSKPRCHTPRR